MRNFFRGLTSKIARHTRGLNRSLKSKMRKQSASGKDIKLLQKRIGYRFKSPALLENALVHTSYANENVELGLKSNERMEFLGDSVLGLVIADFLHNAHTDFSEGRLSIVKSKLVSGVYLTGLAREMKLGDFMYLGRGEEKLGGRERDSILACAFEAVMAAVYLDGGIEAARDFVIRMYKDEFGRIRKEDHLDYKSRLQKLTQARFGIIPCYHVIEETGPDHKKLFKVCVRAGNRGEASALGNSKKEAQQKAARMLYDSLGE